MFGTHVVRFDLNFTPYPFWRFRAAVMKIGKARGGGLGLLGFRVSK